MDAPLVWCLFVLERKKVYLLPYILELWICIFIFFWLRSSQPGLLNPLTSTLLFIHPLLDTTLILLFISGASKLTALLALAKSLLACYDARLINFDLVLFLIFSLTVCLTYCVHRSRRRFVHSGFCFLYFFFRCCGLWTNSFLGAGGKEPTKTCRGGRNTWYRAGRLWPR